MIFGCNTIEIFSIEHSEVAQKVSIYYFKNRSGASFDWKRVFDINLWKNEMSVRQNYLRKRACILNLLVNNIRQVSLANTWNIWYFFFCELYNLLNLHHLLYNILYSFLPTIFYIGLLRNAAQNTVGYAEIVSELRWVICCNFKWAVWVWNVILQLNVLFLWINRNHLNIVFLWLSEKLHFSLLF